MGNLIRLLIENVTSDPDEIARRIKRKLIKSIKSEYYRDEGEAPTDDIIEEYYHGAIKYDPNAISKLSKEFLDVDPTGGKYINWILSTYYKERMRKLTAYGIKVKFLRHITEDLPKVKEYLELFHKYKDRKEIEEKDINQYNSLGELYDVIKPFKLQENAYSLEDMLALADEDEYEIKERSDSDWIVIYPHSEKTACIFGVNTEWCTAWGEHSLNVDYQSRTSYYMDNLIIIINKNNPNEKYQLHFNTNQFMDVNDHRIDLYETFGGDPLIIDVLTPVFDSKLELSGIEQYQKASNNRDYEVTFSNEIADKYANKLYRHNEGRVDVIKHHISFLTLNNNIKKKIIDTMEAEGNKPVNNIKLDIDFGEHFSTVRKLYLALVYSTKEYFTDKTFTLTDDFFYKHIFYHIINKRTDHVYIPYFFGYLITDIEEKEMRLEYFTQNSNEFQKILEKHIEEEFK